MKYFPFVIVLLVSFFFVNDQFARNTPPENTVISLQIEGASSQWIYLRSVHENVKSKLDSAWLDSEGKGGFQYDLSLDPGYYELVLSEDVSFAFLLDQDQTFALKTDLRQLVRNMEVEGSLETSLLYQSLQLDIELQDRFQAEIQHIQQSGQQLDQNLINQLREKYFAEKAAFLEGVFTQYPEALFAKYEKAKQEPQNLSAILSDQGLSPARQNELLLNAFWAQVDLNDERLLHTPVIFDKLWAYFHQFAPDQTDIKIQAVDVLLEKVLDRPAYYAFFATWLADEYIPPFTGQMDPDALYTHLVNNYLTPERAAWADSLNLYAWQLRAASRGVSLVGMQGADFEARRPDGMMQALYDIQSPYIALFFYHYDCDHCMETAPQLVEQYEALKEQGLEVVAVAMDTPEEEWVDFIQRNGMNWINVTDEDNQAIYDHYSVWATPEIMLLDPDRTIIGKHLAVEDIPLLMRADQARMRKTGKGASASVAE
ncbi:MAG: thioredoxin family protein [Lewinella sp.]|nr:thioredoxin family protein [Lewinella sp.]